MDNFVKLLNNSLRFLSYRPRSEKEVRDYLKKKKASDLDLEKIIKRLLDHKYIDDKEFVKWFIEQRSKVKPKALKFILFELKQKGISKEVIGEVLEDKGFQAISDLEKAFELAKKRIERLRNEEPKKRYEKMVRFLASKGFDWDTIKKVIDRLLPRGYNSS